MTLPPERFSYRAKNVIGSVRALASTLGETEKSLREAAEFAKFSYREKTILKTSGKTRTVYNPKNSLKIIQKKINSRIFSLVDFPIFLQGSIRDIQFPRDYLNCASQHCRAGVICKLDIQDFFGSINYLQVQDIFTKFFHFPEAVSETLSKLTTLEGFVPQGAPTSSHLANLVFFPKEEGISSLASAFGARYTRLVDDITISHSESGRSLERIVNAVRQMIDENGFTINEDKTVNQKKGTEPLLVHGVKVDDQHPRLLRNEIKNIRVMVHQLEELAKEPNARTKEDYRNRYSSVSGKVNKLKRVKHPSYVKLRKRMRVIIPLPSRKMIVRVVRRVKKLERKHRRFRVRRWYQREYHKTVNDVGILGRTYTTTARKLKIRLREIKPNTDSNEALL